MQAASTAAVEAAPVVQSSPVRTGTTEPPPALPFRIGHGFDLHRLEEGYPLIIGGIPVKVTARAQQIRTQLPRGLFYLQVRDATA